MTNLVYKYKVPNNFDENNQEFDIFKNLPDEIYFSPKIEFYKKVRIATNSVLFNYFKIFKKSCISEENYQKYQKGYKFFLKFIFPKINFSKKRFLLITDEWTSNYYHWHVYSLKRLLALKRENLIDGSLLFLPKKYKSYKFILPSLKKFGVLENQIVFSPRKSNIKVEEAVLADISQQDPEALKEIRQILLKNIENNNLNFGEKIYISRDGQVLRFVENEKEVVELLEKYGFKKVVMDKFSYNEQVAIAAKAKYAISPHGAGLTNILFMQDNSSILEMVTKPSEAKPNTEYYRLSSMLNFKYFYQECEIGSRSKVRDFHQGTLIVDLKKLEKNLRLMLNV